MKYAASLVKLHIDERLKALRTDALARGIPVTDEETLNYLLLMLSASRPRRILEIGTAVGLSAAAMLPGCRERRPLQQPVKHKNKIFYQIFFPCNNSDTTGV